MPTTINAHNTEKIELNPPDQVTHILSAPPSWMFRYGLSVMGGACLLVFILSWMIRFPDVVQAKCYITTANPPIRVIARNSGRISNLTAVNGQNVETGQILAVMESTADWQDVLKLETWLAHLKPEAGITPPDFLQIGDLQPQFAQFVKHLSDLHYFSVNKNPEDKIRLLSRQIAQYQSLNKSLEQQKKLLEREHELQSGEFERQKNLFRNNLISAAEMDKSELLYWQQYRQMESWGNTIVQNEMQIRQLEGQILDLKSGNQDAFAAKTISLSEDIRLLQNAIEGWKQNYLICAPINGRVSLNKVWSARQPVNAGEEVLAVVPGEESSNIIAKASLPTTSIGMVTPGNKVLIHLDGFPAQRFGVLETRINSLSLLPDQHEYLIDLDLPDTLRSSFNLTIPFKQEMSGEAHIITEERRISDRIFGTFYDLLYNR